MSIVLNVGQNNRIVGGSDRYHNNLGELLTRHHHEVIPFAARHEDNRPTDWDDYFPPPVDFAHPGPSDLARFIYSIPARRAIDRLIAARRPDVAHLHIYYGQLSASILAPLRRAGIPIVQTLHEYKTVCPTYGLYAQGQNCEACTGHRYWHAVARRCNRNSLARSTLSAAEAYVSKWSGSLALDHFLAVSDFVRDKVISMGLPGDRVTTVHNFMDCNGITPSSQQGRYVLYFGRLERTKGLFTLLDAIAPLRDVPLLIVGRGSEGAAIEAEIARRGLDHVKMLGFQSGQALIDLIRESFCTVAPALSYETFGLSLVESFAHGRPVVASRIGGMTEVVSDGVDGWLVPPGDAEALRGRLAWMAANRAAGVEMGWQGRLKVERQFHPEAHYRQIMSVYRKVGVA